MKDHLRVGLGGAGNFKTVSVGGRVGGAGMRPDLLSVVVAGKLVTSLCVGGEKYRLAVLGPGDTIGEMGFAREGRRGADAEVCATVVGEPARLWTIDREAFDAFVQEDAEGGLEVMRAVACALCRRLRQDSETMLSKALTVQGRFSAE